MAILWLNRLKLTVELNQHDSMHHVTIVDTGLATYPYKPNHSRFTVSNELFSTHLNNREIGIMLRRRRFSSVL